MITTPDDFIGRQQQLNEIITRLRTLQSSSVVGERRIGKSSLLYHLSQTGTQRIDDVSYRFVYLDFQDIRMRTAADFLRTILEKLRAKTDGVNKFFRCVLFALSIESLQLVEWRGDEKNGAFSSPLCIFSGYLSLRVHSGGSRARL